MRVLSNFLDNFTTWAELHNKINESVVFISFIISNDIRMVNFLKNSDFLMKCLDLFIGELRFRYDFDGNLKFLIGLVLSNEDLTEAARAKNFSDIVKLF